MTSRSSHLGHILQKNVMHIIASDMTDEEKELSLMQ